MNIIIAIGEYIQKQVFLNGGKNTLEVPKIQKLISVDFCFDTFKLIVAVERSKHDISRLFGKLVIYFDKKG